MNLAGRNKPIFIGLLVGEIMLLPGLYALTEVTQDADYCLELGFTNNAGKLRPNEHVEIQLGFNPADWSNYNQENDYSFMPETHDFVANEKYTVYHQQILCWGKEPKHRPQITAGKNRAQEYHLELAFLGESAKPLPIELNGESLSLSPSLFLQRAHHLFLPGNRRSIEGGTELPSS